MIAADHRKRVAELETSLFGTLGHAERSAVLNAGKGKLRSGSNRLNVVKERAVTKVEAIDIARIEDSRVVGEERMRIVDARLAKAKLEPMARSSVLGATSSSRCSE